MEYENKFVCSGDGLDETPEAILRTSSLTLPDAHKDRTQMALLAKELKGYYGDLMCRLPFCSTVEAEAFGGDINLGNDQIGPRVKSYVFKGIDELHQIKRMNLCNGRVKEVLAALSILRDAGEVTVLNVTGPFTIATALLEPVIFYKELRKSPKVLEDYLQTIADSIVEYMVEGIKKGASLISYADPAVAMDIVGPRIFENVVAKLTINILKSIESHLNNHTLHLCGKLSTGMEKAGFIEITALEISEGMKYGEGLLKIMADKPNIKFVGNACIKKTSIVMKQPVIWQVTLK